MKKVIIFLLTVIITVSLVGCFNSESDPLDRIDFENGTINIDTAKIDQYIKNEGYTSYNLIFEVDKSIYQCKVSLPEEESEKIVIDGDGYDSFIASARKFLIDGTSVMSDVLTEYGLDGISCGMFLTSSDGVVYCSALNGTVNYVGHTQSDTVSVDNIKQNVEKVANEILKDKLTITVNNVEKFVSVFYEGPANGGSEQTKDTVNNAFNAVKSYLNTVGLTKYKVGVYGYDGQPKVEDPQKEMSDSTDEKQEDVALNNAPYSCVAKDGNDYIFEVVANKDVAASTAQTVIAKLKEAFSNDNFLFYIVDENETFLGKGDAKGYVEYKYKETYDPFSESPPYQTPFSYYFRKYFNGIETKSYQCEENILPGGTWSYTFKINALNVNEKEDCQSAADTILKLMNLTLGDEVKVIVKVFEGTENEIVAETILKED